MPRPRSLTPQRIAGAALAVIDRDGLGALTMRSVAAELGMAPMSLYRYVDDRDALERLVVDHVFAGIDHTVPPRVGWRRGVTVLLERVRDAVRAHPEVVPLLVAHRHSAPASLGLIEAMLVVLDGAGFTGRRRVVAQRTLISFLLGTLQNEHYGALAGTGTATMAQLSEWDYPMISATAREAVRVGADDEFHRGLEIVLRGLEP